MDDNCLGTLALWGLGIFGVLLVIQYIVIPYWYVFLTIILIGGGIFGGNVFSHKHADKQKSFVQSQITEFPQKYSTDATDMIIALNNAGSHSVAFDLMVNEYLIHRESLSDESRRLNRLAEKYGISERLKDPNCD